MSADDLLTSDDALLMSDDALAAGVCADDLLIAMEMTSFISS